MERQCFSRREGQRSIMWEVKTKGYDPTRVTDRGNRFLIGHLNLGIRGTLDEHRRNEHVAVHLPLVYDRASADRWREPINVFNPLYTTLEVDFQRVDVLHTLPDEHEHILNIKNGLMSRKTVFSVHGKTICVDSSRFVMLGKRLIVSKYSVQTDIDAKMTIRTGIDTDIWDISGTHIDHITTSVDQDLRAYGTTREQGRKLIVIKRVEADFSVSPRYETNHEGITSVMAIDAKKGVSYTIDQYAIIGLDANERRLEEKLDQVCKIGYQNLLFEHEKNWEKMWDLADVQIEGDNDAQFDLRYSIYHLLLLTPTVRECGSIPARGISGQTYKGAVFWDTEMFLLPFYLNTDKDSAKRLVRYRIDTLSGARNKAESYGFKGAFYPWESQDFGYDACTDHNVTDAWNRPLRTYFKDKQIHISADIVYAIMSYIGQTEDDAILKEGALEVIMEVARFYLDYGHYAILKDRFEIWDVMGPDEYHERVKNNAFTNRMVKFVFNVILTLKKRFDEKGDHYFSDLASQLSFASELEKIEHLVDRILLKTPDGQGIIEQFDDYFALADVSIDEVLRKRVHKNEYLGISALAADTKIIKQADVITMLYLFSDDYDVDVKKANWNYYEKRTEHGSTLSASMYALVACQIGEPDLAYPYFMKSASVDLEGTPKQYAGDIYIGGTHPAAAGGAYMVSVFGFAGLRFRKDHLEVHPRLPKGIESIRFGVNYRNKTYRIYVTKDTHRIEEI
jgi:nigerose phosphorylase